jgi:hypothetical protein
MEVHSTEGRCSDECIRLINHIWVYRFTNVCALRMPSQTFTDTPSFDGLPRNLTPISSSKPIRKCDYQ